MEQNDVRSSDEIAIRCVILNALLFVVHGGASSDNIQKKLKALGLWNSVSPLEKQFLLKENYLQEELDEVSWKRESLFMLLWTLREVKEINEPNDEGDISIEILQKLSSDPLLWVKQVAIRSTDEISKAEEDIYNIHWAVRNATINNQKIPNNYNINVVFNRHYAINWVEKYNDAEWDNITVDT